MSDETFTHKLPPPGAPLVAPPGANDLSGATLGGYRLVRKIAQGGMGVIYEAIQTRLDRKVALKILSEPLASRPEFLQRFEREAKAAAALNHPNVVQVHDFGEADGRHFIIMEYIDGANLSSYVAVRGKLPVAEALNIIEQAAQALKAAAEKSIIHRDIKPSNLMLTHSGVVKVADLGLAKILTQDSELTLSNIVGSPHFIAPEQAADSRKADHRVDIYSLGITLFFLLTGKFPFEGNSPISIVLAHSQKPLPSAAELGMEIPEEVEALIHRMAAKNPDERYQDYDSLLADLQLVKSGYLPMAVPPLPPTPAAMPELPPAPKQSKKEMVIGLSILGFVLLVAAAAVIFAISRKPSQTTVAANSNPPSAASVASAPAATPLPPAESERRRPLRPENNFQPQSPDRLPGRPEFSGGNNERPRFPMPMGPPPRLPEADLIPDGPVATMLAAADEYAAQNPRDFQNILARYRQVQQKAVGTTDESEVSDKMRQWTDAQNRAATKAISRFDEKMRVALSSGDSQAAYNVWRDFPSSLRSRETDRRIMELLQTSLPADFRPQSPPNVNGADRPLPPQ